MIGGLYCSNTFIQDLLQFILSFLLYLNDDQHIAISDLPIIFIIIFFLTEKKTAPNLFYNKINSGSEF